MGDGRRAAEAFEDLRLLDPQAEHLVHHLFDGRAVGVFGLRGVDVGRRATLPLTFLVVTFFDVVVQVRSSRRFAGGGAAAASAATPRAAERGEKSESLHWFLLGGWLVASGSFAAAPGALRPGRCRPRPG